MDIGGGVNGKDLTCSGAGVASIGGNNDNFASIVQTCVEDFLVSPSWWPLYGSTDSSVISNVSAANVSTVTTAITGALLDVGPAMANAGYSPTMWSLLVQDYPSPASSGLDAQGEPNMTLR